VRAGEAAGWGLDHQGRPDSTRALSRSSPNRRALGGMVFWPVAATTRVEKSFRQARVRSFADDTATPPPPWRPSAAAAGTHQVGASRPRGAVLAGPNPGHRGPPCQHRSRRRACGGRAQARVARGRGGAPGPDVSPTVATWRAMAHPRFLPAAASPRPTCRLAISLRLPCLCWCRRSQRCSPCHNWLSTVGPHHVVTAGTSRPPGRSWHPWQECALPSSSGAPKLRGLDALAPARGRGARAQRDRRQGEAGRRQQQQDRLQQQQVEHQQVEHKQHHHHQQQSKHQQQSTQQDPIRRPKMVQPTDDDLFADSALRARKAQRR
jgi:hypothetical protein